MLLARCHGIDNVMDNGYWHILMVLTRTHGIDMTHGINNTHCIYLESWYRIGDPPQKFELQMCECHQTIIVFTAL